MHLKRALEPPPHCNCSFGRYCATSVESSSLPRPVMRIFLPLTDWTNMDTVSHVYIHLHSATPRRDSQPLVYLRSPLFIHTRRLLIRTSDPVMLLGKAISGPISEGQHAEGLFASLPLNTSLPSRPLSHIPYLGTYLLHPLSEGNMVPACLG